MLSFPHPIPNSSAQEERVAAKRHSFPSPKLVIQFLLVLLTIVAGSKNASAHAELVRANPAPDSILGAPPQHIDLWFSERVDQGAGSPGLSVLDEDGRDLQVTNLHVDPTDAEHVIADVAGASAGTYTIVWSSRSADDGHSLTGSYTVRVATGRAPGAATTEGQTPRAWAVTTRWLTFLGAAIVAAGLLFRTMLQGGIEVPTYANRRIKIVAVGAAVALVATASEPFLQSRFPPPGATKPDLGDAIAGLPNAWWLRLAAAGVALLIGILYLIAGTKLRRQTLLEWAGAAAAFCTLLGLSLTSHASARSSWRALAIASDYTHLVSVGLWTGGLVFLTLYWLSRAHRSEGPDPIRRFSKFALVLVLIGIATGLTNAGLALPTIRSLWQSDYGRVLIAKGLILLPALALAALHRQRLRHLAGQAGEALRPTIRVETAIVACVVLGGTILALMAPPAKATSGELKLLDLAAPAVSGSASTDHLIRFQLAPAKQGANTITVFSTDKKGQPIPNDKIALVRMDLSSLDHGAIERGLGGTPNGSGGYTFQGDQLSLGGWWRADTLVRRLGVEDETAAFYFMLPDPNVNGFGAPKTPKTDDDAHALFQRALGTLTSLHSMSYHERLSGGTGTVVDSDHVVRDDNGGREPAMTITSGDFSVVTIGKNQWIKEGNGAWEWQAASIVVPPSQWGDTYDGATAFQLGTTEEIDGAQTQIVTFYVPPKPHSVAAWFAWWIDVDTGHVIHETMISRQHYMVWDYADFNKDFDIQPPAPVPSS
ncbi:MAG: copper resistance CopC/CopD family protein [Thermomicrobiales bacterium]